MCLGTLVISTGFQAKISKLCWSRPHNLLRPPSVRVKPIITVCSGYSGFIATLTLSYNIGLVVGRVFSGSETEAHSSGTNLLLFRTDDLDAYDSECDDISSAKAVLMANLSSYSSDVLSEQFWTSVSIKKSNDAVRLQALIDKKKVIITEDSIRQALQLDDADNVDCLPNEEFLTELAKMGYEKPSTNLVRNVNSPSKFYMYPRFLQLMTTAQIADLSSHNTKYTSHALTQKVFANMRRVGKGFLGVDTPLFAGMLVPQQAQDIEDAVENEDAVNETCATLTKQVANLEQDKVTQAIEITKLKQRVNQLEKKRQFKSLGLKRLRKVGTAQRVKSSVDTVMDDQEDASK
nr:hypothetical protein [Tanacetum cinerariifolium]